MKRILAGLLAVGMAAALSLAPAMAETDAGSESAATDREETMTASVVQSSAEPTHLEFDDIRAVLRHNSYTVKSLEAALSDLNHQDTDELWDAIRQMRTLKSTLEQSLKAASDAYNALSASLQPPTTVDPGEGGDTGAETGGEGDTGTGGDVTPELPDPTDAYLLTALGGLQAALSADVANVEMQIASLESQLDSVDSTIETTENTLNNTINQLKNRRIRFVEGQYRNGTFKPVRQKGNGLSKTDAMRIEISKTLPKNKDKVKPGYKRKRMAMVDKIMRSKKRAYIQSKIKQQRVERYKSAQRQKREEAQ